jgi:Xaa-Pro aminopeptidase
VYDWEDKTPAAELDGRISDLQTQLINNAVDAALILQRTDLYYYCGTIQQAHLYVPAQGDPILMVYKSLERAAAESSLTQIVALTSPKQITDILAQHGYALPAALGLELDVLPTNLYFTYQQIFERSRLVDVSQLIRLARAVKSPYELDLMQQAAAFSDQVAQSIPGLLREGMTELELAGRIEAEARKLGHQGILRMRLWGAEMFYGHLMSGPSAAVPSYLPSPTGGSGVSPAIAQGPGFKPIRRNEPVLVDYVFAYKGYLSDHARIYSLGKIPAELAAGHAAMLEVQDMIKALAKPGVKCGEIYRQALKRTRKLGYEDYFMGADSRRVRFVGHGIGLELDEFPFLAEGQELELEPGMTIALEPKLVFPGKGVVGIENTHVVTEKGLKQLSHFQEDIVVL